VKEKGDRRAKEGKGVVSSVHERKKKQTAGPERPHPARVAPSIATKGEGKIGQKEGNHRGRARVSSSEPTGGEREGSDSAEPRGRERVKSGEGRKRGSAMEEKIARS